MKPICLALQHYRYWCPVALLCAGVGFMVWQKFSIEGTGTKPVPELSTTPTSVGNRGESVDPQTLVADWQEAGRAAESASSSQAITLSSPQSPERMAAFRKLVAGMNHANAAGLFTLLQESESPPREEEWQAFLEKWGRLDGERAATALEGRPDGGRWLPGLLRAWASVDPEAAVTWLNAPGQAEVRSARQAAAEREMILGWLKADPAGAAAWLNTHRANPGHAAATAVFAKEVTSIDPENAREWANSIEGPWRLWAQEAISGTAPSSEEGYDLLTAPPGDAPGIHISGQE